MSILICGDFAPIGRFAGAARRTDPSLFGDLVQHIKSSDVKCLNLEAPLLTQMKPEPKAGPVLAAHPDTLNSVVAAGFDTITLANNHILDHGSDGLEATLDVCQKAGLSTVGAGSNSTIANKPLIIERNGLRVAILAFAEQEFNASGPNLAGAAILDPVKNVAQIIKVKESCDALLIILHGGNEFFDLPRPGLRDLCHLFAHVGANAVVCHHPHVVGAYEEVNGVPIHYSLGNLVFDRENPPKGWNQGYAVRLAIELDNSANLGVTQELFPYEQDPENQNLNLLIGNEKQRFTENMNKRNRTLVDPAAYERRWAEYCESVSDNMLSKLAMPRNFRGTERLFRALGLKSVFFSRSVSKDKLNLLRCPSHRDVLIKLLEKK